MVQPDQTRDPVERLAVEIRRMQARITTLERGGLRIPILDADPAADDPTTLWMFNDGRLRGRDAEGRVREWATTTPGATTSGDPKPAVLTPHLHATVYSATGLQCYCPVHGKEDPLYFGQESSTHGERLVMVFLDDATIRADLAGATVQQVEMSARTLQAFGAAGVDIAWGAHAEAAEPATYKQKYEAVWTDHWPQVGGDDWRTMPNWFGVSLRDDVIRGLVVNQPSTSNLYFGRLDSTLSLRITYTHAH